MSDGEVDFDGFLLGQDSDTGSHGGRHRRQRTDGSTHSSRWHLSQSDRDNTRPFTSDNADKKSVESWDKHGDERRRQAKREELAIALSSGDDESSTGKKSGSRRLKPSLSDNRENACISPLGGSDKEIVCYQPGEEVESRFGGRSKWFPGRIRRAYEAPLLGVVYDIAYDDGDMEEGVLAGRVRRPGQKPPAFHAGLQVDIKLGRKGKGYHHGVIGRVNDDGSLYIKFDDGDAEWSLPVQHAIASYVFTPVPGISTTREEASSSSVDASSRTECERGKTDNDKEGGSRDASTRPTAEKDETRFLSQASSPESRPLDQLAPNNDNASKAGPSPESNPPKNSSDAHQQSVSASGIPTKSFINSTSEPQKTESSGLSWITAVANSAERSITPVAAHLTTIEQPESEGRGTGETKTVSHPYIPFSTGVQLTGVQGMPRGVSITEGSSSASITAYSLPSSGSIPSVAGTTAPSSVPSIPRTTTPSHLTWTTSKQSTAGRRWGAPPPDDEETAHVEQLPSPRLLKSEVPAQAVALNSAYSIPTASHTAERQDTVGSNGTDSQVFKIAHKSGDDHVPISENHRLSRDASSPGAVVSTGGVQPSRQDLANETESGKSGSQEHHNGRICESRDEEALAKRANHGEAKTLSQGSAKSTSERDAADVSGGSHTPLTQLTGGADPEKISGMDSERGGGSAAIPGKECCRSKDLQASVQRRYTADAVHLSEEVRLLRAKLRAADDSARDKLVQQARELKEQMQEALEFEREKASKMMRGARAACARRISDLRQENDTLKRRLSKRETELASMTARVENPTVTVGRRHGSSLTLCPNCGHATSRATHRNPRTRNFSNSTASTKERGGVRKFLTASRPHAKTEHLPPSPMTNEVPSSASRGSLGNVDPPFAEAIKASAAKKEGSLYENLERLFVEGMSSRDKSIRALTARLEELEEKREGASASRCLFTQAPEPDWRDSKSTTAACFHPSQRQQHQREETPWRDSRAHGASGGAGLAWGDVSATGTQGTDSDGFFSSGRRHCSSTHQPQTVNEAQQTAEALRLRLARERKETRRKLESMKEEVARVVRQSLVRADRAEAAAASAEETARTATLRYLAADKERKKLMCELEAPKQPARHPSA